MTQHAELEGVILAGGRGSRLSPLTDSVPKPLLPVCNRPIIQYQIDSLRRVGVRNIYIVVSSAGGGFRDVAERNTDEQVRVELVVQEMPLGIAHALKTLRGRIRRPFLLLLGDSLIFPDPSPNLLARFESGTMHGVLAAQEEPDPERMRRNFAIFAGSDGRVADVIEKPRAAATNLKGCGAYLFDLAIFEAIERTPRSTLRGEYELTDSIKIALESGAHIETWVGIQREFNITTPRDLLECNLEVLRCSGERSRVASTAHLADGVHIENSIIGDDVRLFCPSIVNSVVFSGVTMQMESAIANSLVTKELTIRIES